VVREVVHARADHLPGREPGHRACRRVDERRPPVEVEAEDSFAGGRQDPRVLLRQPSHAAAVRADQQQHAAEEGQQQRDHPPPDQQPPPPIGVLHLGEALVDGFRLVQDPVGERVVASRRDAARAARGGRGEALARAALEHAEIAAEPPQRPYQLAADARQVLILEVASSQGRRAVPACLREQVDGATAVLGRGLAVQVLLQGDVRGHDVEAHVCEQVVLGGDLARRGRRDGDRDPDRHGGEHDGQQHRADDRALSTQAPPQRSRLLSHALPDARYGRRFRNPRRVV
jgi:hypothetical protein